VSKRSEYPDADGFPSLTAPTPHPKPKEPAFPCVGCGGCCTNVRHVPDLQELGWVLPNGRCMHLDPKTKRCNIYADRPTICRIDAVRPPLLNPKTWVELNWHVCGYLHKQLFDSPIEPQGRPCLHALPELQAEADDPDDTNDAAPDICPECGIRFRIGVVSHLSTCSHWRKP